MKKFKLQKGIIAGSLAISMLFSGCNNNINTTINNTINNDVTLDNDANIDIGISYNKNSSNTLVSNQGQNSEDKTQNDKSILTAEIEQVEFENGKIGYKLPTGYVPYGVNKEYPLPSTFPIAETTEEYTIYELPIETDRYGNKVEVSYEGAIGVSKLYCQILASKRDILNKYGKTPYIDTLDDYSFASPEEQAILIEIDDLQDFVAKKYYENKGVSLKR